MLYRTCALESIRFGELPYSFMEVTTSLSSVCMVVKRRLTVSLLPAGLQMLLMVCAVVVLPTEKVFSSAVLQDEFNQKHQALLKAHEVW